GPVVWPRKRLPEELRTGAGTGCLHFARRPEMPAQPTVQPYAPESTPMALFGRKSKRPAAPSPASRGPVRVPATAGQSAPGQGAPGAAGGPSRIASLEPRIRELGEDMLTRARSHKSGILSAKFYSDKLMNWSMQDQNFKVQ